MTPRRYHRRRSKPPIGTRISAFALCTHGRNWGFISETCEAKAEYYRKQYPDRLACRYHAFEARYSQPCDPDWVPLATRSASTSGGTAPSSNGC
jgi:hypothetical protein